VPGKVWISTAPLPLYYQDGQNRLNIILESTAQEVLNPTVNQPTHTSNEQTSSTPEQNEQDHHMPPEDDDEIDATEPASLDQNELVPDRGANRLFVAPSFPQDNSGFTNAMFRGALNVHMGHLPIIQHTESIRLPTGRGKDRKKRGARKCIKCGLTTCRLANRSKYNACGPKQTKK